VLCTILSESRSKQAEAIKAAIKREKIKARFESSERKQTRPKGQKQNKLNQKYN